MEKQTEEAVVSEESKYVSITEAAKLNKVTRQAIYIAIKLNKLRAKKDASRWTIHLGDLKEYRDGKYSRTKSTYEGELLFNNDKGFFSINQVAQLLKVPAQKVYYAARSGYLNAQRKGAAWVVHVDDVENYKKSYLAKKRQKNKAS